MEWRNSEHSVNMTWMLVLLNVILESKGKDWWKDFLFLWKFLWIYHTICFHLESVVYVASICLTFTNPSSGTTEELLCPYLSLFAYYLSAPFCFIDSYCWCSLFVYSFMAFLPHFMSVVTFLTPLFLTILYCLYTASCLILSQALSLLRSVLPILIGSISVRGPSYYPLLMF